MIILKKRYQFASMKTQINKSEQDYECGICLMAVVQPVRCRGPCKKWFCKKCAVRAIAASKHCPNRCSSPFVIQAIPQKNQNFKCPFLPQTCTLPILNTTQMLTHALVCKFASESDKQELYHQQNFSCKCGHRLCFLDRKSLEVVYGLDYCYKNLEACQKCKQKSACRSLCLFCSTRAQRVVYCGYCRPIPCTKTMCPMGHNLKSKKNAGKARFCDQCDSPAGMIGQRAYGYCPCDFDLCEICQAQAPSANDIVPLPSKLSHLYSVAIIEDISEDSEWIQNSANQYMSQ